MNKISYQEMLEKEGRIVFTPGGTSMRPMLRHHQNPVLLLPKPQGQRLHKYDVPFYQRDNGQYVLHRILKVKKDSYVCCGDGQVNLETGVRDDMIFAVLAGYYKGDRFIDVSKSLPNKLYARFWVAIRPIRWLWVRGVGRLRRIFGHHI